MNCSCNSTNLTLITSTTSPTTSEYPLPVNIAIKLVIVCPTIILGVYALLANSLILYFMHKKRNTIQVRSGLRRSATDIFIQSLALFDMLSSLISLLVWASEMFIDHIIRDLNCKLARYAMFFFSSCDWHELHVNWYRAFNGDLFSLCRSK